MREQRRDALCSVLVALLLTAGAARGQTAESVLWFHSQRGNAWWVEVEVSSPEDPVGVDVTLGDGTTRSLRPTDWGSWAESFYVAEGTHLSFQARTRGGMTTSSPWLEWPSGQPISAVAASSPEGVTLSLPERFVRTRGNDWWVETELETAELIVSVEAMIAGGTRVSMTKTPWNSHAASHYVSPGSAVQFLAVTSTGERWLSALYRWPDVRVVTSADPPLPPPSVIASPPSKDPATSSGEWSDVEVMIDTRRGPEGQLAPVLLDGNVLGTSIADWESHHYETALDPVWLAYLQGLRPRYLRWPAGHSSQNYRFVRTAGTSQSREITADHVDAFMRLVRQVGAEPVIAINLKTQPAENAADLVRFLNQERGYGVRWFQLGNEPDHEDGLTRDPWEHSARHRAAVAAMRAVDPSISFVGPEVMTGASALGLHGVTNWMDPILEQVGHTLEAVSWHWYALDSGQWDARSSAYFTSANLLQEDAPDWEPAGLDFAARVMPILRTKSARFASNAPIWITEFGQDPGPRAGEGISDTQQGAVWAADALGRYLGHGAGAILKWVYKQSGVALTLLKDDDTVVPEYLVWWLYANHFGDEVISAESSERAAVNAHGAWRPDGRLSVVVVNKTNVTKRVGLGYEGFFPTSGALYLVRGQQDSAHATVATLNDNLLGPEGARAGVAARPSAPEELQGLDMPPMSVALLLLQ
ncbi:MAG: hypothetical protein ACO3JL_16645 [Myxococcota bacterium]